jgi:hypothetical protein
MTRTNYNKLLVSLTDRIMVWMDEVHDQPDCRVPYIGNNTAAHMATAAMNVLASIDDLYDTLVENGEVKE